MRDLSSFLLVLLALIICSCEERQDYVVNKPLDLCEFKTIETKFWKADGRTWIFGGEADSMHFDISQSTLDVCNLNFGLGREKFQALLEPQYMSASEVDFLPLNEKCIVVGTSDNFYVYPYIQLSFHEAINEVFDGEPTLVAYCVRADLAVVYSRVFCDTTLHFGVSGYTYSEPLYFDGKDAFLLWDRETESLWWPFSDLGVAGFFNNTQIEKFPEDRWSEMTWNDVLLNYPNSKVLAIQSQLPPKSNFKLHPDYLDCF